MSEQEQAGADPWDDSALLNAFDNAIAKYKKMNKKTGHRSHPSLLESSPENVNHSSITEENNQTDSHTQQLDHQTSQVNLEGYTDSQGELYKQYYELEDQRLKLLQQLQQSAFSNHQHSGQEYQYLNQQVSNPAPLVSYCCPCVCPCLLTPSACSLGGCSINQIHSESTSDACAKPPSLEDDAIVKTAIGAAERAIASMNLNGSSSNMHQGSPEVQMTQNTSPEADLSVVLNAWYLAGFYTGKYISEQSNARGRRG